eukprot:980624-Rhodomonas_salina.1
MILRAVELCSYVRCSSALGYGATRAPVLRWSMPGYGATGTDGGYAATRRQPQKTIMYVRVPHPGTAHEGKFLKFSIPTFTIPAVSSQISQFRSKITRRSPEVHDSRFKFTLPAHFI